MTLIMRNNNHCVGFRNHTGHLNLVEHAFGWNSSVVFAFETVGGEKGRPVEPICQRRDCVVVPVMPLSVIVSARVGEERFTTCLLNAAHYFMDKKRLHIIRVSKLTHMQLNCHKVAFLHAVEGACFVVEAVDLFKQVTLWIPRY